MNFGRRLRLFLIGVVLGSIVMYFYVLKDRDLYKSPTGVIIEKLKQRPLQISSKASCKITCAKLDTAVLRKSWNGATVDFSKSKVSEKPCPTYAIKLAKPLSNISEMQCQVCDDFAILIDIEYNNCGCDSVK